MKTLNGNPMKAYELMIIPQHGCIVQLWTMAHMAICMGRKGLVYTFNLRLQALYGYGPMAQNLGQIYQNMFLQRSLAILIILIQRQLKPQLQPVSRRAPAWIQTHQSQRPRSPARRTPSLQASGSSAWRSWSIFVTGGIWGHPICRG